MAYEKNVEIEIDLPKWGLQILIWTFLTGSIFYVLLSKKHYWKS